MAESSEVHPSLEGIFHLLAQVPEESLIGYKHKLSCERQDRRSSQLLQTMILLTLGRETEARRSLDALRGDPLAARISRYGSATANTANLVEEEEEAEVWLAVARIYSLLVDAKWCGPAPRDEAYRAAVAAFRNGVAGEDRLRGLADEALENCGMGFTKASDPIAVPNSSDPQPLRSTGSPTSILSHLEISQSLTVPFRTHSVHYGTGISKLCGDIRDAEERNGDESVAGREERYEESVDLEGSRCSSSDPSVSRVSPERSAQCPEPAAGKQVPPRSLLHDTPISSADSTEHPQSSAADSSSPKPPSNVIPGPPPAVPSPTGAKEFFTYVVVHAGEDEAIACRVKAQLESMGVSDGATYSEDFLVPGRCQLGCFENALDDSAFTLFLMTENFNSRLCAYQTNVALMDSFTRFCKANTVIPFIPKERPLKAREMPLLLAGLVPMDENSLVFASRVKNTFRAEDIRKKKAAWSVRRQIRERERLQEQNRECQQLLWRLSELGMNMPYAATSPQGFPGHAPQPCFYPSLGMPQLPPGPDFMFSQGFAGAQPPLIIQNAQMVQIGDYNNMQVERTNATLGTAEENGVVDP